MTSPERHPVPDWLCFPRGPGLPFPLPPCHPAPVAFQGRFYELDPIKLNRLMRSHALPGSGNAAPAHLFRIVISQRLSTEDVSQQLATLHLGMGTTVAEGGGGS